MTAVVFAGGGRMVTGTRDGTVHVWGPDMQRVRSVRRHRRPVTAIAVSSRGLAASGDAGGEIRIWPLQSRGGGRTIRAHADRVHSLEFSRDGARLVSASRDHDARVWRAADGSPTGPPLQHFGEIRDASFSPDGQWVVTAGPVAAGLWESRTGRNTYLLAGHEEPLTFAGFVGRSLVVTASRDGTVRRYRCEICGTLPELVALARRRLAATKPR